MENEVADQVEFWNSHLVKPPLKLCLVRLEHISLLFVWWPEEVAREHSNRNHLCY